MQTDTLLMTMLFDFYGDVLTERQRFCFDLYYNEDLSLGEIAQQLNISRQGVRDLIVRSENTLTELESKIGLYRRFSQQRITIEKMHAQLRELSSITEGRAREIAKLLEGELEDIGN